jgi:hypothetical protein
MLTLAALVAIAETGRATGMKVENAFALATIGRVKAGAVYMTLNVVGANPTGFVRPQRTLPGARPRLIHHIGTHDGKSSRIEVSIRSEATKFDWPCMIAWRFELGLNLNETGTGLFDHSNELFRGHNHGFDK